MYKIYDWAGNECFNIEFESFDDACEYLDSYMDAQGYADADDETYYEIRDEYYIEDKG